MVEPCIEPSPYAGRARAVPLLEFLDAREINSPAYAAELADLYARLGRKAEAMAKAARERGRLHARLEAGLTRGMPEESPRRAA